MANIDRMTLFRGVCLTVLSNFFFLLKNNEALLSENPQVILVSIAETDFEVKVHQRLWWGFLPKILMKEDNEMVALWWINWILLNLV